MGPSAWSQLIGLILDEADINITQRGLELINVPYGHTCRSKEKSTSNMSIIASICTTRSHLTILSVAMEERQWRIINHKNFDVKVRLPFLMAPFGSVI